MERTVFGSLIFFIAIILGLPVWSARIPMMSGGPQNHGPLSWAREQLGLDRDAIPADWRTAAWQQLASQDFVPPLCWQLACELLCESERHPNHAGRVHRLLQAEWEACLRDDIDRFASSFFDLAVEPRTDKWQKLSALAHAFPTLRQRLLHLERGLRVVFPNSERLDTALGLLLIHIRTLFQLRPLDRTQHRQRILSTWLGGHHVICPLPRLRTAVEHLQRRYPEVAALEPVLLTRILTAGREREQLDRIRARKWQSRRNSRPAARGSDPEICSRLVLGILILGAITMMRMLAGDSGSSTSPDSPPSRALAVPAIATTGPPISQDSAWRDWADERPSFDGTSPRSELFAAEGPPEPLPWYRRYPGAGNQDTRETSRSTSPVPP